MHAKSIQDSWKNLFSCIWSKWASWHCQPGMGYVPYLHNWNGNVDWGGGEIESDDDHFTCSPSCLLGGSVSVHPSHHYRSPHISRNCSSLRDADESSSAIRDRIHVCLKLRLAKFSADNRPSTSDDNNIIIKIMTGQGIDRRWGGGGGGGPEQYMWPCTNVVAGCGGSERCFWWWVRLE